MYLKGGWKSEQSTFERGDARKCTQIHYYVELLLPKVASTIFFFWREGTFAFPSAPHPPFLRLFVDNIHVEVCEGIDYKHHWENGTKTSLGGYFLSIFPLYGFLKK